MTGPAVEITVPASGIKSPSDTAKDADALKQQRQAQAAAARAAKVAKQASPRVSGGIAQTPVEDVSGANGADGTDDDDMGLDLVMTGMSPGEAKDAALALIREVYSAGHVAEVLALRKELNQVKLFDVPVSDGHSFYARAMKLAQSTGLRQ